MAAAVSTFTPGVNVNFPVAPTCFPGDTDLVDSGRPEGRFAVQTSELPEWSPSNANPALILPCS